MRRNFTIVKFLRTLFLCYNAHIDLLSYYPMNKERNSKTKQFFSIIAERIRYTTVDMVDLLAALMDPLDYKELAAGGSIDGVRAKRSQRAEFEKRRLLAALERQQWIVMHRAANRITIALTTKGKAIFQKEKIRTAHHCPLGQGILVTFDIPERTRKTRDQFRFFLKECNFQQVQRSVWFTPCDVYDEIRNFIQQTKSEKWIHVFRVLNPFDKI